MDNKNKNLLKDFRISIKDKWEFLNKLENKDSNEVADLYRYFMQMTFKHIPLKERPDNNIGNLHLTN
jgi:hypothetical protein